MSDLRMKCNAMITVVVALLVLSIVVNASVSSSRQNLKAITVSPIRNILNSQVESENLVMESNADFALFGATGVGTRSEPYRIENLQISYTETCILVQDTTAYFVISNCKFQSNGTEPAVLFSNVENGRVDNCEFTEGASGIKLYDSIDCSIANSTFYGCSNGIRLTSSANSSVIGNEIHNNNRGVLVENSQFCEILDNSIYSNWQYGIEITFSASNNTIYGNSIGWNVISGENEVNAIDSGFDNAFDDGVSIGNYWDDYNSSEPYIISGTGSSIDDFAQLLEDNVNPALVPLNDIAIDVNSEGNSITWQTYDLFPKSYTIRQNTVIATSAIWDGGEVTFDLDHLSVGTYEISISVVDGAGNSATDTISVTVVEFILGGLGTELVMIASGITLVVFLAMIVLVKKMT
jgi:parallel beta-helix repeat protein